MLKDWLFACFRSRGMAQIEGCPPKPGFRLMSEQPGSGSIGREALLDGFARFALSSAFLSAIADRFGLWGPPGSPNTSWGDFHHFVLYTAKVTAYLPSSMAPAAAWFATIAELVVGIGLLTWRFTRSFAVGSGVLLLIFAVSMSLSTGIKSALAYSVFSASAAAFLLAERPKR